MKLHLAAASMLMIVGLSASVYADETRTEGLSLELTPYFWAAGADGKISARGQTAHFDRSFSDIIKNTDAAFMGLGVISYNRFVLYADYDYLGLSDDVKTKNGVVVPTGTKVKGELNMGVGTYAAGYRFDTFGENTMDVLFGVQLTDLQPKVKIAGQTFSNKSNLTDTVVMLRPSFQISEKWRFNPTLAYGISGDSDTTYSMMPQVQYQFSNAFAARFGYKKLYYKESDGSKGNNTYQQFDGDVSGMFIGVGWTFPAR